VVYNPGLDPFNWSCPSNSKIIAFLRRQSKKGSPYHIIRVLTNPLGRKLSNSAPTVYGSSTAIYFEHQNYSMMLFACQ